MKLLEIIGGSPRIHARVTGLAGVVMLHSNPFLLVTHLSELALLVWLLVRGVNAEQWENRARECERSNAWS